MEKKKEFLLVNAITTLRVLGIFALIPLYLSYGGIHLAITNILCFLTDFIDGSLARKFKVSTFFGSLFDGLSDKGFLIINMVLLAISSPYAIIPILLEAGIFSVGVIKYKNNLNLQSNMIGKVKMWVAGISVIVSDLLMTPEKLTFLGTEIVNKLTTIGTTNLLLISLTPLIISETVTLISYIKEYNIEKYKLEDFSNEKIHENNIIVDEKDKTKEKQIQELLTLKEMLFDYEFYQLHKNDSFLKEQIKKRVLKKDD